MDVVFWGVCHSSSWVSSSRLQVNLRSFIGPKAWWTVDGSQWSIILPNRELDKWVPLSPWLPWRRSQELWVGLPSSSHDIFSTWKLWSFQLLVQLLGEDHLGLMCVLRFDALSSRRLSWQCEFLCRLDTSYCHLGRENPHWDMPPT